MIDPEPRPLPPQIKSVLDMLNVRPVLVDLGASGSAPDVWDAIAEKSVYIGFDPDRREMNSDASSSFLESHIVPCAITADGSSQVVFYLTQSPFCSSTLEPDGEALDAYLYADLFNVESVVDVQASRLDEVFARLGFERVHWFKADTQGTDLRLFHSLSPALQEGVLAIDMEPGLMDSYVGEDLFPDVHSDLCSRGFWLSRIEVKGAVRMRPSTLKEFGAQRGEDLGEAAQAVIRESPTWCEARYLRTISSLEGFEAEDWALAWVFAMMDEQFGFALDLSREYRRRFEDLVIPGMMEEGVIARLKDLSRIPPSKKIWRRLVPVSMRRALFHSRRWLSSRGV